MSGVCFTSLQKIGYLTTSMSYLFKSRKALNNIESNTVFVVFLILVPLFSWGRYSSRNSMRTVVFKRCNIE